MDKKTLKGHFKNLGIYFGATLIPMLLSLFVNPWIAKNMAPEQYAITGYYTSFTSLISPIIQFYLIHYFLQQYFRLDDEGRVRLFSMLAKALIVFSGIVALICFGGILIYVTYFTKDLSLPVHPYLFLAVFAIPFTGLLNLQLAQYKISRKARSFFFLSMANGVMTVFMALLLVVWIKLGAFGKLLGTLLANASIFIYLLYRMRKILAIKTPFKPYLKIFKFCVPLTIGAMLGYFTTGYTTTFLESLGDMDTYSLYVVGNSIGMYLTVFSSAIGSTFQPELFESTIKKQWRRFTGYCILQLGLISVVVIAFLILAPFVISILTYGRYNGATPFAQIIAVQTFTRGVYYLINNFSIATGRPNSYLITNVVSSIAVIIVLPPATEAYGYVGGCWVSTLSFLLMALVNYLLLKIPFKMVKSRSN